MINLKVISCFNNSILIKSGVYSFLNFASLGQGLKNLNSTEIKYFCDGMLMAALIKLLTRKNVERVSFDFTSIAPKVFDYCEKNDKKVFFVGAEQNQLNVFISKIKIMYPELRISGARNGYFGNDSNLLISEIINSNTDMLIVGLGAGKQESFLLEAINQGFNGLGFTCGGFIRQESYSNQNYYPYYINKYNLRAFYRMYKEPHTIRRYILDYPINAFAFVFNVVKKKLLLDVS